MSLLGSIFIIIYFKKFTNPCVKFRSVVLVSGFITKVGEGCSNFIALIARFIVRSLDKKYGSRSNLAEVITFLCFSGKIWRMSPSCLHPQHLFVPVCHRGRIESDGNWTRYGCSRCFVIYGGVGKGSIYCTQIDGSERGCGLGEEYCNSLIEFGEGLNLECGCASAGLFRLRPIVVWGDGL